MLINFFGLEKLGSFFDAYRFDSGTVCGLPDLFNDEKLFKELTLTHLLYRSHNIVYVV